MQLEGLRHLAFSVAIFLKNLPVNFEVSGWAQKPAPKSLAFRGEETGTAETLAVEQVLPAVPPEGVAAILDVLDVAGGRVRRALLDPESQLLPRAWWPMRVLGVKVSAPMEVSITNLVPHQQ